VCVGRLGLICHVESRDKVISSLPGLSRLDNEINNRLPEEAVCMGLREQTDQQGERV
jgi:hypothetical protein